MIDSLGSIRECLRMLVDLVAVGLKDNEGCIGVKTPHILTATITSAVSPSVSRVI